METAFVLLTGYADWRRSLKLKAITAAQWEISAMLRAESPSLYSVKENDNLLSRLLMLRPQRENPGPSHCPFIHLRTKGIRSQYDFEPSAKSYKRNIFDGMVVFFPVLTT